MTWTKDFVGASPYHLKYRLTYDGAGGAGSGVYTLLTQAALVADMAAGGVLTQNPIRDLINSITNDGIWTTLASRSDLSLYLTIVDLPAAGTAFAVDFAIVGGFRVLRITSIDTTGDGSVFVELKYRPQLQRSQGPT
jgi:hypothetical protein